MIAGSESRMRKVSVSQMWDFFTPGLMRCMLVLDRDINLSSEQTWPTRWETEKGSLIGFCFEIPSIVWRATLPLCSKMRKIGIHENFFATTEERSSTTLSRTLLRSKNRRKVTGIGSKRHNQPVASLLIQNPGYRKTANTRASLHLPCVNLGMESWAYSVAWLKRTIHWLVHLPLVHWR